MLSKSKGQILRVAAGFHALFYLEAPHDITSTITVEAIVAATDFVQMCTQHVAFMAGRGDLQEYMENQKSGVLLYLTSIRSLKSHCISDLQNLH